VVIVRRPFFYRSLISEHDEKRCQCQSWATYVMNIGSVDLHGAFIVTGLFQLDADSKIEIELYVNVVHRWIESNGVFCTIQNLLPAERIPASYTSVTTVKTGSSKTACEVKDCRMTVLIKHETLLYLVVCVCVCVCVCVHATYMRFAT
jgi:hypothetical protein